MQEKTDKITIYPSRELRITIKERAIKNKRSISGEILLILEEFLKKEKEAIKK
jgi:hypothetical protein